MHTVDSATKVTVKCAYETDSPLDTKRAEATAFSVKILVEGTATSTSITPEISILPEDEFQPLALNVDSASVDYTLSLPIHLDLNRRRYTLGEVKVTFKATIDSTVEQTIALTDDIAKVFGGGLDIHLLYLYSSVSGWTYTGDYVGSLMAEDADGVGVDGSLGLIVMEEDVFDDVPREYLVFLQMYISIASS